MNREKLTQPLLAGFGYLIKSL